VLNAGGCAFITADHGNAEKMMNPDGTPFTAHTTNVVPFVAVGCGDVKLREGGCLADIAHHAALHRPARPGRDDRQEHHRRVSTT
jgi:pgm_bpd_ind: 2,3-bisphosphoglycerate-independent phosphoglycerate mutase